MKETLWESHACLVSAVTAADSHVSSTHAPWRAVSALSLKSRAGKDLFQRCGFLEQGVALTISVAVKVT